MDNIIIRIAEQIRLISQNINIKLVEPMNRHTSFMIGGAADILVEPSTLEEVIAIVNICKNYDFPFFVLGKGSNILVSDKGIRAVVIKLGRGLSAFSVDLDNDTITAGAGISLSRLSQIAMDNGLSGIEFACGIPGTLGGAVAMNAGAYGKEMKDVVLESECLIDEYKATVKKINNIEHQFGYRNSIISKCNCIILGSKIQLKKDDKDKIKSRMDELNDKRTINQPLEFPSAGSIFKRPEGYYVGKMVNESGLKGYTIGGAQISNKHCGFIINIGHATAKDVLDLIKYVQSVIKERYSVMLETEIKLVGEF